MHSVFHTCSSVSLNVYRVYILLLNSCLLSVRLPGTFIWFGGGGLSKHFQEMSSNIGQLWADSSFIGSAIPGALLWFLGKNSMLNLVLNHSVSPKNKSTTASDLKMALGMGFPPTIQLASGEPELVKVEDPPPPKGD